MIKIDIDDREVKKELTRLAGRIQNRQPLMLKIAGVMHDAVEENFEQEGRPRWKPSKRAQRQGGKTLQDTGQMAASVAEKYDNDSALVGTNKKQAAIHQFGGKAGRGKKATIPARPVLKLTDSDLQEIKEAIKDYLKED